MSETYFLLFDVGVADRFPGFPGEFPFSELPVCGSFTALEMSAANIHSISSLRFYLITSPQYVKQREEDVKEWSRGITVLPCGRDLPETLESIPMVQPGTVIIQDIASVVSVDSGALHAVIPGITEEELLKCSVRGIPVDMYMCTVSFFRQLIGSGTEVEHFFKQMLLNFTKDIDLPGMVFVNNTLFSLFQSHQSCIGSDTFLHPDLSKLYGKKPKDCIIGKSGSVKNSLISPGTKIDGQVVNSFLFENVQVREGAKISNSVIFPGHTIGKKAVISNAVLLPSSLDAAAGATIGDKAIIGGSSKTANKTFPEHIQSGLTVIGFDTEIPGNLVMEASSCIDYGVTKSALKQRKVVKKGAYISPEE